jgi:hypothetical protein
MNDLDKRLQDVNEAGVYRLNCDVDVLREAAAEAGLALIEVDLCNHQGKGEFLAAIAAAIQAPSWFGHNFDALADALGDLSWRDDGDMAGYVLLLYSHAPFGLSDEDYDTVIDLFDDTVDGWRARQRPFWIFFR